MNFIVFKKIIDKEEKEFIHINLNNIGFLKINNENDDSLILSLNYRKKATEKSIEFKTSHNKESFRKFISKYKFFLLEKYFINVTSIDFVDEENINSKEIKLHFYFKDGQNIMIKTERTRWDNWRNLRLK